MPSLEWIEPLPLPGDAPMLHQHPLLSEILYRRGFRDPGEANDFLDAAPRHAPDPSGLPNLEAAIERILHALRRGERIAIYGDYDADGITATALLVRALRAAADSPEQVIWRVPTREEGYGLHEAAIDDFDAQGASVLLTVDCGSSDHAQVGYARRLGLDVIILDHHQMADDGPSGAIVVSAQRSASGPFRELTAAGLAYLLVSALAREGCQVDGADGEPETHLLDLAAIGTIADVAPLTGANRPFVRDGLRRIHQQPRPGIAALCQSAALEPAKVSARSVAFRLAPRLNAAGRVAHPGPAVELLLTDDSAKATALAVQIERLNERRKAESQRVLTEAEAVLARQPELAEAPVLLLAKQGWTSGVLGIAAAKLADQHAKPAFVFALSEDGQFARGSGRSLPGLDITRALTACDDLLLHFGGHAQAAGVTLHAANLPALAERLAAGLAPGVDAMAVPGLHIEADLPITALSLATARLLANLEPFGQDNEAPLLRVRDLRVHRYNSVGRDASHLSLHLATGSGIVRGIAWGAAPRSRELVCAPRIDIVGTLSVDEWGGTPRLQIEVLDFRPS